MGADWHHVKIYVGMIWVWQWCGFVSDYLGHLFFWCAILSLDVLSLVCCMRPDWKVNKIFLEKNLWACDIWKWLTACEGNVCSYIIVLSRQRAVMSSHHDDCDWFCSRKTSGHRKFRHIWLTHWKWLLHWYVRFCVFVCYHWCCRWKTSITSFTVLKISTWSSLV